MTIETDQSSVVQDALASAAPGWQSAGVLAVISANLNNLEFLPVGLLIKEHIKLTQHLNELQRNCGVNAP